MLERVLLPGDLEGVPSTYGSQWLAFLKSIETAKVTRPLNFGSYLTTDATKAMTLAHSRGGRMVPPGLERSHLEGAPCNYDDRNPGFELHRNRGERVRVQIRWT